MGRGEGKTGAQGNLLYGRRDLSAKRLDPELPERRARRALVLVPGALAHELGERARKDHRLCVAYSVYEDAFAWADNTPGGVYNRMRLGVLPGARIDASFAWNTASNVEACLGATIDEPQLLVEAIDQQLAAPDQDQELISFPGGWRLLLRRQQGQGWRRSEYSQLFLDGGEGEREQALARMHDGALSALKEWAGALAAARAELLG